MEKGQNMTSCRSPLALVISNVIDSGYLYKAKNHPPLPRSAYTHNMKNKAQSCLATESLMSAFAVVAYTFDPSILEAVDL